MRYRPNDDWLHSGAGAPATLRLHASGAEATRALAAWVDALEKEGSHPPGRGGWTVQRTAPTTMELTATGEDAATSIQYAAEDTHDFLAGYDLTLEWVELPRK